MSVAVPPLQASSFAAAFEAAGDKEGEEHGENEREKEKEKEKEKASLYWLWGAVPSPPPLPQPVLTVGGTEAQEVPPPSHDASAPAVEKMSREATGTTTSLVQEGGGRVRDIDSLSTTSSSDDSSSRSSSPGAGPHPASMAVTAPALTQAIRSPVPMPIPMQRSSMTMFPSSPPSLWTRSTPYVGREVPSHTPTPPRGVAGVVEEDAMADSVYQAFVKKWCFAHEGLRG